MPLTTPLRGDGPWKRMPGRSAWASNVALPGRSWFVRKTGINTNGGSSPTVRSTGTDGATTTGTNVLTSASASWTSADVGHGVFIGGVAVYRVILSVVDAHTIKFSGATIVSGTSRAWTVGGAWLTIGQSMTNCAAGGPIVGGDSIYIGAGHYRETTTGPAFSPYSNVSWIGDTDGSKTGDAGYVLWSNYTTNDRTAATNTGLINLSGKQNLTFANLILISGNVSIFVSSGNTMGITISKCCFFQLSSNAALFPTISYGVNAAFKVDKCIFYGNGGFAVVVTRGTGADYNCGVSVTNCLFANNAMTVASAGAGANFGGGVAVSNCSFLMNTAFISTSDANVSTSIPCTVNNCWGRNMTANTTGQIVEDYNLFWTTNTNITQGAHSVVSAATLMIPHLGQAQLYGFLPEPPGAWMALGSAMGFGNASGFTTLDLLSNPRPSGAIVAAGSGTASAGGATTLTDSAQTWGTNVFAGYTVKITGGTGAGQLKSIASNTATVLTVDGNWQTNPDNTSTYQIYNGAPASSGQATAGSTTTLTDSNAAWGINQWQGYTVSIDGGTGVGRTATVTSNTSTALTFANIGATLDSTSTYELYRGTDGNTINPTVGCYERGNVAIREATTVRGGSNAGRIQGAGGNDFQIPVSATQTTFSVWAQFDANYSGPAPQLIITNAGECGVSDASASMGGVASGTWEQINLTITPTSSGYVTVRLQSNSTTPTGAAYFDDFSVS